MNVKDILGLVLLTALLSGCGGGDAVETDKPFPPVVQVESREVNEGTWVTLTAEASDSDGTVEQYQWRLPDGESIPLEGVQTASVSFFAPEVTQDSTLRLEVTVTDDSGLASTATATLVIKQVVEPLALVGQLPQALLSQAEVTLDLGEGVDPITVQSDAEGGFRFDLLVDIPKERVLSLTAKGQGERSHIELHSLLTSYAVLREMAYEDGVVDPVEFSRLRPDLMTTVEAVLAREVSMPIQAETLYDIKRAVDPQHQVQLAGVMSLMLTDPAFPVPEGQTIVSVFSQTGMSAIEALDHYYSQLDIAYRYGATFLDAAARQVSEHSAQSSFFNFASFAEGEHRFTQAIQPGWVPNTGYLLDLQSDGRGWFAETTFSPSLFRAEAIQWEVDGGVMRLAYEQPLFDAGNYETLNADVIRARWGDAAADQFETLCPGWNCIKDVYVESQMTGRTFYRLSNDLNAPVAEHAHLVETLHIDDVFSDWQGENPSLELARVKYHRHRHWSWINAVWSEAPTGTWALVLPQAFERPEEADYTTTVPVPASVTLLESGDYRLDGEIAGRWQFEMNRLTLETGDGWQVTLTPIEMADGIISASVTISNGSLHYQGIHWIVQQSEPAEPLAQKVVLDWPLMLSAQLSHALASCWDGALSSLDWLVGYRFWEDGTMGRYWAEEDAEGWQLFRSGIQRHWNALSDAEIVWESTGQNANERRHWTYLNTSDRGRMILLERIMYQFDDGNPDTLDPWGYWVYPRINVFEALDLEQYEWAEPIAEQQAVLSETRQPGEIDR
ncbi:PKD domain-containing protein [Ferrimonas gelatinilytica]|uniref:PKD/Chitinase domain-containing protein n=1 Tax=Ferrimonas gelatinilytica TaxID=1255257 RepID=A0ABP9S6L2_9GAMM